MAINPITRDEAAKILQIEDEIEIKEQGETPDQDKYYVDPKLVMERFDTMMDKNSGDHQSFYLQSKIYFAKEFFMMDHPAELNESKFNPVDQDEKGAQEEGEVSEEEETEEKKEKKEDEEKK